MSFNTKFSMWWGSVTTKTEKLFNKEKKRIVTHEYYDNPNAKSTRPRSMHSIRGSMRMQNSARSSQAGDDDGEFRQRSSSKRSSHNKLQQDDRPDDVKEVPLNGYDSVPQHQYPQEMGGGMLQNGRYMQPQIMQNQQYNQQLMQGGYPTEGYANQNYSQGY